MKVSINLAQFFANEGVDFLSISHDELLTKIGQQLGAVESVTNWAPRYEGVPVVKVVSCEQHPNADRLHVCLVDDGGVIAGVERDQDGLVQVVCGAPNVRAGMFVAWLAPGLTVPSTFDTADPFVLEARELRGVVSNGMLASAKELGISDDHDGIMEIIAEEIGHEPQPGEPLVKLFGLDDFVIDCENKMFTHRPDCFGNLGVAREIAGITEQTFQSPDWYLKDVAPVFEGNSRMTLQPHGGTSAIRRFTAVPMDGVAIKKSPVWLQAALTRLGYRPINNVVDVTNFVMHLTAQPLHAFDYDKLLKVSGAADGDVQLGARLAKTGETLALLNGKTVELTDQDVVISCNGTAVALGGIMGGAETEVDENTTRIVLEAATFDMYVIRRTSMRLGLFTDAVTRFSKGQNTHQNMRVLAIAAQNVQQFAGGEVAGTTLHTALDNADTQASPVSVSSGFINDRLGSSLSAKDMQTLLERVEFIVDNTGDELTVTPPFWRMDIELPEDIVEEVGRLHGYGKLPVVLPKRPAKAAAKNNLRVLKQAIRRTLEAAGANELLCYTFVNGKLLDKVGQNKEKAFHLRNALSPDLQYYRLSLTPSLLEKVHANNKAGHEEFAIYELGSRHQLGQQDKAEPAVPRSDASFALVVSKDDRRIKGVSGAAYYSARKYIDTVFSELHVTPSYRPYSEAEQSIDEQLLQPFDSTRSALVYIKDEFAGVVGEYRDEVVRQLKLPVHTAGFELNLHIIEKHSSSVAYRPLSRFPNIAQDICLRTDPALPFVQIYTVLQKHVTAVKPEDVELQFEPIDVYQKDPTSQKQTTFRVSVVSHIRTLNEEVVSDMLGKAMQSISEEIGAERV